MNILKNSILIEKNEYQKLYNLFGFEKIFLSLFSGINDYRFFEISSPDKNHISFKPKNNYSQLKTISYLANSLKEDIRPLLLSLNTKKTFHIKHKHKIMFFLHMDWILVATQIKEEKGLSSELNDYLKLETGDKDILKKIKHTNGTSQNRSNIFTINKNSVIVHILNDKKSKNLDQLTISNQKLILKNPLISFIEISKDFDNEKLTLFLKMMNQLCKKVTKKQTITDNMKFSLKIRKIKRTHKKGLYIVNQNSILLDPRHVDSFIHELGHWYHTFFIKNINEEKQAERFANDFENFLKK